MRRFLGARRGAVLRRAKPPSTRVEVSLASPRRLPEELAARVAGYGDMLALRRFAACSKSCRAVRGSTAAWAGACRDFCAAPACLSPERVDQLHALGTTNDTVDMDPVVAAALAVRAAADYAARDLGGLGAREQRALREFVARAEAALRSGTPGEVSWIRARKIDHPPHSEDGKIKYGQCAHCLDSAIKIRDLEVKFAARADVYCESGGFGWILSGGVEVLEGDKEEEVPEGPRQCASDSSTGALAAPGE